MASEQQTAANRANAQKSTGPKTPEGRAAVRLNSVKHGLTAETLVLPGENFEDFETLFDDLVAQHQPATPTDVILVRQLAMAAWRQLRLFRMEVGFYKSEHLNHAQKDRYQSLDPDSRLAYIADRDAVNENALLNFHRFEVRLERSIRSALQELRRCRAERAATDEKLRLALLCKSPEAAPNPPIVDRETVETPPEPVTPAPEQAQDEPLAA